MKLLPKLTFSLVLLGAVLALTLSFFGYHNMESYLVDMYSYRVVFGAKSIAAMLNPEEVKVIVSEGGDQTEAYTHVRGLLNQLKREGEMTYLSLVTLDEDSVTFYIDSNVPEMGDDPAVEMPYGADVLYTDAAASPEDLQRYHDAWSFHSRNLAIDPPWSPTISLDITSPPARRFWMRTVRPSQWFNIFWTCMGCGIISTPACIP